MHGEVSAVAADYVRVDSLEAAIAALAKGPRTILAGGTDVFPRLQDRPLTGAILDISGIAALGTVAFDGDYWRIGAAASWRSSSSTISFDSERTGSEPAESPE